MRQRESLRDRARGRWPGILAALGVPAELLDTRKHQPCPWCGGKDRYRFTDKDGDGRFICNQCGSGSGIDFAMKFNGWDFARAAREIEAVLGEVHPASAKPAGNGRTAMQRVWDDCSLIAPGDFVDRWFVNRGIRQGTYSRWIRKADSLKHETEEGEQSRHPAMVCKIMAPDGKPANLHRTYLTLDGQKANVDPVRKTMWGSLPPGSAIRLFDPGPVLGIAEGIETAFAAAELFQAPVWSAINSTLLAKWEPPVETREVVIFGDNDAKFGGLLAAGTLAHRLACRGIKVRVEIPTDAKDWNDVLLGRKEIAA